MRQSHFQKQAKKDTWSHEVFRRGNLVLLNRTLGEDDSLSERVMNIPREESSLLGRVVNRGQRVEANDPPQFAGDQPLDRSSNDGNHTRFNDDPNFSLQVSGSDQVYLRDRPSCEYFPIQPAIHSQDNARSNPQVRRFVCVGSSRHLHTTLIRQIRGQLVDNRPTYHESNHRRLGIGNNNAPIYLGFLLRECKCKPGNCRSSFYASRFR